jgi:hypothetical protein
MKHIFSIALLFFIISTTAYAQFFQTGQDPSQIRWRQINTNHFQVIYPEEFDKEAQRLSFVLSKVYDYGTKTMNFNPRKISVVLHTRTVQSNGMVAWAPKRIELFTTPHQQIYAQDWLEQLALHEFRHLVQMDKIQSELPFLLKFILGEQAAAIVTGVYLPFWFLEGDAVVTETALSHTGRGRMASFSMEYRAQLIDKGKYSFDKAFLGSYKDFVPDHYKLGYWMVGKSREKYGSKIWSDVLDKVGNQPLSITPLNSILKKETGMSSKKLYNQIFEDLKIGWKQDLNSRSTYSPSVVSPMRKNHTDYLYPEFYKDSFIVAYRTSIDDIGRFVLISPDKSEKIIYTPGTIFEESVSMRDQLIIWAEKRADIRWTHADRSVILIYNIETKQKHEIAYKNKLFSPVISPDLKSFAAVEVDPGNNFFLSVFDLDSGKLKERFKTDDNQYFFTPCWDEKGEKLYFVSLSSKGKYLASLDLQSKQFQEITSITFGNLKNPVFTNNQLIFSADFSGTDHLYSLNIDNHQITRIYDALFGADYPSAANSKNQILFSNYSASGYQLSIVNLADKTRLNEVTDISLKSNQLADNLSAQEKGIPDFANNDSIKYSSKKYSKLGHLFNFHSWAPAYVDVNSYEIRPGASIFSQNKLGTAETRLGYDYNIADRTGKYSLAFNYSGLFPEFNTSITYGNEASNYYLIKSDTTIQRYTWNELTADLDIRLPLNLSKGKYSVALFPEIKYTFNQVTNSVSTPTNFYSGNYHALTYRLYYYHLLNQSDQNIMPRWGQQFDIVFRHTPFVGNSLGTLAGIQSVLYFPGLTKNDGIKIYQGYQEKIFNQNHNFSNFVRFPRGFQGYQNNKMYSFAADYRIPLVYPDMSLGKLVYLKRIKASLFYDYAWLSIPVIDQNNKIIPNHDQLEMNSLGLELTSDLHILRFFAPIDMGVRSIYLPGSASFRFELLLSIDFNGF